jgi:spore coat protein U-like protein
LLQLSIVAIVFCGLAPIDPVRAQSCSATVNDIDFGAADVQSGGPTDVLTTLTVTCTRIPFLSVVKMCPGLGEGSGGASGSARLMRATSSNSLSYQLFQDSSRTLAWGAVDTPEIGTVPAILLSGSLSGAATTSRTIYARLFAGQAAAAPGLYTSSFAGGNVAFTYSSFFLGASNSCTGFVGSSVIRPEFEVVAQVVSECSLTTNDLNFGTVGVIQAPIVGQASLGVTCTTRTPYTVSLDGGSASAANPTARLMTSAAGDTLTYGLYRDAARSQPWGATASTRINGTGTGAQQTFQVYGQVPVQRTPRPGLFSDRIVATVTY